MSKETLKANLREIPVSPFRELYYDVTTLFKNAECLQEILNTLYEMYKDKHHQSSQINRGFIMGGALAARLGARIRDGAQADNFSRSSRGNIRKRVWNDTIQIHKDAIDENDVVLCCTMIYWLPAEPWRPLIASYKDVAPKRFSSISLSNWEV